MRTRKAKDDFRLTHPNPAGHRNAPERFAPGDALILAGTARCGWANSLPRRPWVVVSCDCEGCASGRMVALDVPHSAEMLELYPESGPWRHVASAALRKKNTVSQAQANEWADVLSMGCGVGQALSWQEEDGRHALVDVFLPEFAALALADSLGGTELTPDQGGQLEKWRRERGGHEP